MIPDKIIRVGAMLGLVPKDIRNIVSDKSILGKTDNLEAQLSPVDTYIKGTLYGTISINDF